MRILEFLLDPQSNQLSASRMCLVVLVLIYLPGLIVSDLLGYKVGFWVQFAMIISAVCGVYGVNSGLRVWREGQQTSEIPATRAKLPGG